MGVRFFLTQPIYSEDAIENLKLAKQTLSVKNTGRFYANCQLSKRSVFK